MVPAAKPPKHTEHSLPCHCPDHMEQSTVGMNNQQGHMERLMCHADRHGEVAG